MIARAVGTASLLLLASCDGGLATLTGGDGEPINVQVAHPAGVILEVVSFKRSGDRSLVNVRVLNGRDRDIELAGSTDNSYLLTDSAEKLLLVDSLTNAGLAVPAGKAMDGALVFAGALPNSGNAVLVLNAQDTRNSEYSSSPRFEMSLPLDRAGSGSVPETSELANMRGVPVSRFGPVASDAGSFSATANASSSLQAVEKLKSDLGAVETDRGTVVALAGDVTFDFDKDTIRGAAKPTLDRLAQLIAAGGAGQIAVEGHTDTKGDDGYNKRLSEARAAAVKAYLTGKGVDGARLRTIGLGELRPVAPNAKPDGSDDEAGRQRNRRVEVILPSAGATPAGASASTSPSG